MNFSPAWCSPCRDFLPHKGNLSSRLNTLIVRLCKAQWPSESTERLVRLSEPKNVEQVLLRSTSHGASGFRVLCISLIEGAQELSQLEAECRWVEGNEVEIRSGSLPWPSYRHEDGRDIIVIPDGREITVPTARGD